MMTVHPNAANVRPAVSMAAAGGMGAPQLLLRLKRDAGSDVPCEGMARGGIGRVKGLERASAAHSSESEAVSHALSLALAPNSSSDDDGEE